jgi:hypothetical protein
MAFADSGRLPPEVGRRGDHAGWLRHSSGNEGRLINAIACRPGDQAASRRADHYEVRVTMRCEVVRPR